MKIAQVAPLYESVPPQLYGGTERVVAYLTDALVRQGHEVTLFASGDSHSRGRLQAVSRRAAVAAVTRLDTVSRRRCRETFEERFCASRMARDYLAAYLAIIDAGLRKRPAA